MVSKKEYMKEYIQRPAVKVMRREWCREWCKKNPDKIKEYSRRKYEKNKEKIKERNRQLYHEKKLKNPPKKENKKELDENKIINLYLRNKLTVGNIAKEMGYYHGLISNVLKKNNIKIRGNKIILNKKKIINLYINKEYDLSRISKIFKCSPPTIRKFLIENNIKIRDNSETLKLLYKQGIVNNPNKGKKLSEDVKRKASETKKRLFKEGKIVAWNKGNIEYFQGKNNPFYGRHHTKITKEIMSNSKKGKPNKKVSETLKRLYKEKKLKSWNEGKTAKDDSRILASERNGMWRGGTSFEPYTYDFNKKFREAIRKRDCYCCMLCNIFEENTIKLYRKRLAVHHIDYNKLNSFPQNCVSLCIKCHGLTNVNRTHWKTFFQSLLKERYEYEYSEDQKIILDFIKK